MRSRAVLALLRAEVTHPGSSFPFSYAAPSISFAPSASSSTRHAVLPKSPPPSLLSGIFGQGPQGYGAPHGHPMEERLGELLGVQYIHILGEIGGEGGGNRNRKLRDLILEKLYQHKETTTYSSPMIAEKLNTHPFSETWLMPRQPWARSFSSDCKYSQSRESEEHKRAADTADEILLVNKEILKFLQDNLTNKDDIMQVNKEILKFLQDNLTNKAPKTAPSSAPSTSTDLETVKPPGSSTGIPSSVFPAGPLGSIVIAVLSLIEFIVKVLQEWIPKDSGLQVYLVMLLQCINLAKDPAAKHALDSLMVQRKIKDIIIMKGRKKGKAGEDKSTETKSDAKKLQQLRHIYAEFMSMAERHEVPLIIVVILSIVAYFLAQVTW